jgi:hypothetical protein
LFFSGIPFAPMNDPWVALKKEYLNEKCRRSSSSSSSAYPPQVPLANNNQNSYGSYPPMNSQSLVNSQGNQDSSNAWAKAFQENSNNNNGGNNPYSQPAVPNNSSMAYPAEFTLPKTSQQVLAPSSLPTYSRTSGDQWYFQSASRAVNQCLGRVIRHCNDWGALFLLDERFLGHKTLADLSGWMRPWVKKFNYCNDSFKEYSNFLRDVTTNPNLYFEPKRLSLEGPAFKKPYVPRNDNQRNSQYDPFNRTLEINESQLGEDENDVNRNGYDDNERTYIPKELLTSQQQNRGQQSGDPLQNELNNASQFLSRRTTNPAAEEPQQPSMNLFDIIGRMKGGGAGNKNNNNNNTNREKPKAIEVITLESDDEEEKWKDFSVNSNKPTQTESTSYENNNFSEVNQYRESDGPFSSQATTVFNRSQYSSYSSSTMVPPAAARKSATTTSKFGIKDDSFPLSQTRFLTAADNESSGPFTQGKFSFSQQSQSMETTSQSSNANSQLLHSISQQAVKVKNEMIAPNTSKTLELKKILEKLKYSCSEMLMQEIKVELLKMKNQGVRFISDVSSVLLFFTFFYHYFLCCLRFTNSWKR